ncbi:MAG: hypothetical protein KAI25_03935 [Hyphomicrobiaceae bacterium]|nr:hypothetical protein [Hyphomicrobiaceae bacterium]
MNNDAYEAAVSDIGMLTELSEEHLDLLTRHVHAAELRGYQRAQREHVRPTFLEWSAAGVAVVAAYLFASGVL